MPVKAAADAGKSISATKGDSLAVGAVIIEFA
jgi:hypothetical protein